MSEITRFDIPRHGNECMHEDPDGEYVQYDDHRAEVERLTAELAEAHDRCRALELSIEQAGATTEDSSAVQAKGDAMCEIERWDQWGGQMLRDTSGLWVRYAAHQFEVERLATERDEARAEVERLRAKLHELDHKLETAQAEVERLKAEVERLTARLEHAQARIVPPLPHADESAQQVQVKMDAYITSLTNDLHETRERLARVQAQYDEFARVTAKTIGQHQRERDEARQQVYRLQQACGDTGANDQGMLDTSNPSDEDIWRETLMTLLPSYPWEKAAAQADCVLADYRKRWPR